MVVGDVPSDDDTLVWCASPYEMKLRKYERKQLTPADVDPDWLRIDARDRELPDAPGGWMTTDELARELHGL